MSVVQLHAKTRITKRWRDALKVHPAADLFPLMSETDLKVLGEDIKAHGLRNRVAVIDGPDGKPILLDGRNRLDAMELVGLEIVLEDVVAPVAKMMLTSPCTPPFDPYAYVISTNIHRRHLTAEQRRELIVKLLEADPEKSNRAIAAWIGVDESTVRDARKKSGAGNPAPDSTAGNPAVEKRVGRDGKARKLPKRKPKVKKQEEYYQDPVTGEFYDSPPEAALQVEANEFNTELLDFVSSYCRRTLRWHQGNFLLSNEHRKTLVSKPYKCAEEIRLLAQAVDECCEP
jgi:hypothetical protein